MKVDKKPNLDDYDNGYKNQWEPLRYGGETVESKGERAERRKRMFLRIWKERINQDGNRYSEISGARLPSRFSTVYLDHLLERSKYPELEFEEENIVLCTEEEQAKKTNGFPSPAHTELIEKAKKRFGIV